MYSIFNPKKGFWLSKIWVLDLECGCGKKTGLRMFRKVNVGISAVAGVLTAAGVPAAA
jgi:hypothetical protein